MKVELHIDPSLSQPRGGDLTPRRTPPRCARRRKRLPLAEDTPATFTAFRAGEAHRLPLGDILRFYTDGKGVRCQTAGGGIHRPGSGSTSWRRPSRAPASSGCPTRRSSTWTG